MKVLIVGDVVGRPGMDKLKNNLPKIIKEENIAFCIVNGENSANGKGIRVKEYEEILSFGADVITMGNHMYYRKEMANEYAKLPRLAIPANITNLTGNTNVLVDKNGVKYGVINLIGTAEMGSLFENNTKNPFEVVICEIEKLKNQNVDYIFVDIHAEATAEKLALGYYLEDKGVVCTFGTHTHVQTADETILNDKMAYITDVGMTGPKNSVIGLKKDIALKRFVKGEYAKYECSTNEAFMNGIIVEIDENEKKAVSIKRVNM